MHRTDTSNERDAAVDQRYDVGTGLMGEPVDRERLVADLKTLVADAEGLMRQAKSVSGEAAQVARVEFDRQMERLRHRMDGARVAMSDRAYDVLGQTEAYVHREPWRAIGFAALAGAVIALALSSRR
jgi:ElaB/YqjD/DUF883 family membrane-anchored ribosome-binding protein